LAFDRKGVAVYDPHTGRITQLTRSRYPRGDDSDDAKAYYHSPVSFSPDGRYLVYECDFWEESDFRIYDRKLHKDLGVDIGNRFAWSSDGTRLLAAWDWYMNQQAPTRLIMWDVKTRKWRTMLRNYRVDNIVWPKGKEYAWALLVDILEEGPRTDLKPPQGPGYYRFDLRTHKLTKVSGITQWIVPSPDYKRFVFQSDPKDKSEASSLYVGETNKWRFRLLARGIAGPWNWYQQSMYMDWSPDGKTLAYTTKLGDIRIVKP
jgi:Tol biopolymer transport system component